MQQYHYDGKSIGGSIATITFAFIGQLTLGEWATIMAIGAGLTTIAYNVIKVLKELKNKK